MRIQFKIIRKKYFKILVSIVLIISLGTAILFGLTNGIDSVKISVNKYIKDYNYPDVKIITNIENEEVLEQLKEDNLLDVKHRISVNTILKNNDSIISAKLSTYNDENINDFYIFEETENDSDYYDILVEKNFAENNNLKIGNKLSAKIDEKYYDFIITKLVSSPEAMVTTPINGLWGEINNYGNVYIDRKILQDETNKKKDELLSQINQKERDIINTENDKTNEYISAKDKINEKINDLNNEEKNYKEIKVDLLSKLNELDTNKKYIIDYKNSYIDSINTLNDIDSKITSYINSYEELSDNSKKYILNIVDKYYPNIIFEDVELITDTCYLLLDDKVNEIFDSNSEINKKITSIIVVSDSIKTLLDHEYDYLNSEEVTNLIKQIKNGEDLTDTFEYSNLKMYLSLYGFIDIVNDDNIVEIYELSKIILEEIHAAENKVPFSTFQELYTFMDNSKSLLPIVYNMLKLQYKPYVNDFLNDINAIKEKTKNEIDNIFKTNESYSEQLKQLNINIYNYAIDVVDKMYTANFEEYTDNLNEKPINIFNTLINDIEEAKSEITNKINEIDTNIDQAHKLVYESSYNLDKEYNNFKNSINDLKLELNERKNEVNNIKGYESKFNEILINIDHKIDKDYTLKEISNNYLKDIDILDSYTFDNSPLNNSLSLNLTGMESVATILPIMFYSVILIVLYLFITLIIKQSKKEIGIFKLLGISNNKIKCTFLINNILVSLFGVTIGLCIGLFIIIYIVNYFKSFFLLPTVYYNINVISILLCFVITIFVTGLATILATLELDKISPLDVIRKEEYHDKKISKFTRFITRRFNPLKKFSFIVYIRNKSKLILSIMCTSATLILMFISLSYISSKDRIFSDYFDKRINYDAQVFKSGSMTEEYLNEIRRIDYVKNADILRYFNVTIKNDGKEEDIVINALDNTNNYVTIFDKDNNVIEYPQNGIVLEEHTAKNLGLKLNDEVDLEGVKFKVVAISFQSLARINYISLSDSYKLQSTFDSIVLNIDNDKKSELLNTLYDDENYIYTVFNEDLKEYNKKIFDSYTLPALIIIAFSIIIGYIIVINVNMYNLLDQKRNFSIYRVLGFSYKEISKNWFIQSLIQFIVSTIIGLPVGIWLSKILLFAVSSPKREFIYANGVKEILIVAMLLFVYIYIGHKKCINSLKRIDIIEEIKDRD